MAVDKNDPKYPEYIVECEKLGEWLINEKKPLTDEMLNCKWQDHPNDGKIKELVSIFSARLKELQKKYGFAG